MTLLSEKYIAGFLDADGSFGIDFVKKNTGFFPRFNLSFSQETKKDKVLHLIKESINDDGYLDSVKGRVNPQSRLTLQYVKAVMLLSRISKHLVIKRQYAEYLLDYYKSMKGPYTLDEINVHKKRLKENRKTLVTLMQNHPTRKWLAGYFDGDGCVAYSYRKKTGCIYISVRITTEPAYIISLELIQKAFGGKIYKENKEEGIYPVWVLHLPPSKAKQFFSYFAQHSVVKKEQIYFVLGCAKGGNFRDGETIRQVIKQLKAQEQRLSGQSVDVSRLINSVSFNIKLKRNRPIEYKT